MKPKQNRLGTQYVAVGYDACQTPDYAAEPLLPYLRPDWTVWEPACGQGLLADKLDLTHQVVRSDILSGQNFFEGTPAEAWDVLVTNPPYSVKYPWLGRCYELGKPFALLLPVETLGAKKAQKLFAEYGLEVIFMDRRINFSMPNIGFAGSAAQFPTAWFTWKLRIGRQMTFAKINLGKLQPEQLAMFRSGELDA